MLEGLLWHEGVRRPEPPLPPEPDDDEAARVDLRTLPAYTIDPEGAKDFDDAISVRAEGDGLRAWVHIADVSAYVPPGSPLDRDAADRGFSFYVPGTVEPMLPHALSSDLCSLRPHLDRRAVTVEIPFDADARGRRAGVLPQPHPLPRAADVRGGPGDPRRAARSPTRRRPRRCGSPSASRPSCGGGASPAARSGSRAARRRSPSTARAASSGPGSRRSRSPTRSSRS